MGFAIVLKKETKIDSKIKHKVKENDEKKKESSSQSLCSKNRPAETC